MDEKPKHTGFPWEIEFGTVDGHASGDVYVIDPATTICESTAVCTIGSHAHDNMKRAHMIAAAPELLDALESCLHSLVSHHGYSLIETPAGKPAPMIVAAQSAIRKARGKK